MSNALTKFAILLVLLGAMPVLWAQTNPTTTANSGPVGRVVADEEAVNSDSVNSVSAADRPDRLERNSIPPDIRAKMREFKIARDRYLRQQENLRKQLLGATDEERAKLHLLLKHLRAEQLERAREMRREFKERKDELKDKLPSRREVLDSVQDEVRNSALQQLREEASQDQTGTRSPHDGVDNP